MQTLRYWALCITHPSRTLIGSFWGLFLTLTVSHNKAISNTHFDKPSWLSTSISINLSDYQYLFRQAFLAINIYSDKPSWLSISIPTSLSDYQYPFRQAFLATIFLLLLQSWILAYSPPGLDLLDLFFFFETSSQSSTFLVAIPVPIRDIAFNILPSYKAFHISDRD